MRSFGSDNHSGVHRDILKSLNDTNDNHQIAYGDDIWTKKAEQKFKEIFGDNVETFFVFNGTGANVISLKTTTNTFNSIIAADTAHICVDECGAPEYFTGASVKAVKTSNGKLTPESIKPLLSGFGFEHHSQPKVVYISQCTELGTVYTCEEIKAIAELIHSHNMYLHMDGARIANAAVCLNKSFKEITVDCGVDILSFGGTKNGMMIGETVVSFRKELSENLKYIRKQLAQLYSKMRYVGCQYLSYFENDLWFRNASNANRMAQLLRKSLLEIYNFDFTQNTDANILLLKMNKEMIDKLLKKHFFYIWNEEINEIRLVTSWDTTEQDINDFISSVREIL
ncbi:MAG: aminotransferase class V-fold PLP-dependent enzyme [Bacteroidales bacterium]|jgi:threonine aldolase|nr:aminotransferase class V-fold PLP-dependent enzyme [Bacteroidales bacterium]